MKPYSMTHRLATNYAKNYCNRTPIVKVIVVTCFLLGHSVYTDGRRGEQTLRPALLRYDTKEELSVVRFRLTRIIITTIIRSNIRRHCFTECVLNTACGVRLWTTSVLTTLQG